jgi:plasmid stabilization system protein ParE
VDVVFTPSARLQFLHAIQTIQSHNRTAARRFHRRVATALKRLTRIPNSGVVIAEFPGLPHREVHVKPYRFFYRVQGERIWIVAVWHGAQLPEEPEIR